MKIKLLVATLAIFGITSHVQADTKVAEYGDPVVGHSYGGCSLNRDFGTGGGGFLYDHYTFTCPSGTYGIGVQTHTYNWPYTCSFYPDSSAYYVIGECNNWRVYLDN